MMLTQFLESKRSTKRIISITYDCLAITLSIFLATYFRLGSFSIELNSSNLGCLVITLGVSIFTFIRLGLYRAVLRYMAHQAILTVLIGVFASSIALAASSYFLHAGIPRTVPIIYIFTALIFVGVPRALIRSIVQMLHPKGAIPTLIYGAGQRGNQLALSMQNSEEYRAVGFIDNDKRLKGSSIRNLTVYHLDQLPSLIPTNNIGLVLLAFDKESKPEQRKIVRQLELLHIPVRTLPPLSEILDGKASTGDIRDIQIEDILGREPVSPNHELLSTNTHQKVVMVTGAGGSIGSELCRQIAKQKPKELILFELNEHNLYKIHQELEELSKREGSPLVIAPLLGSVQDSKRLSNIMEHYKVDTVYHAAAYKHVPLVEQNIIEGLKNNIFGTQCCAQASIKNNVETFVLISTDKAVRPTNLMGASKRIAELTLQALAKESHSTCFSMVRFGNVLGSSGSVVPRFRQQIESGGPVTVTHPEITRYFMTTSEAAQLVIQAGAMGEGGDVFVLEMGEPVKIADMAREMILLSGLTIQDDLNTEGDVAIEYTGLRAGEKLYEELLVGNNCTGTQHPRIMRAEEEHITWQKISEILSNIVELADKADHPGLRELMLSSPAAYQPSNGIDDLIFNKQEEPPKLALIKKHNKS